MDTSTPNRTIAALVLALLVAGCAPSGESRSAALEDSAGFSFVVAPDDTDEGDTTALDAAPPIDANPGEPTTGDIPFVDASPNPAAVSELVETTGVADDAPAEAPNTGSSFDLAADLPSLDCDLVYQAWLVVDGAAVPAGSFDIGADGAIVDPVHGGPAIFSGDTEDAAGVVISIEDPENTGLGPGPTRVLAGPFDEDGNALLTTQPAAALSIDFSDASGTFILATPTNGLPDSDELSGIWFEQIDESAPSLDVPVLPDGWTYEAWVVIDGRPVSLGQFSDPGAADDFDGFSDTAFPAPDVPGEDFLVNPPDLLDFPLDLTGQELLVTIEPAADTDAKPFGLTLFRATIPENAEPFVDIDLGPPLLSAIAAASISGAAELPTAAVSTGGGPAGDISADDLAKGIAELDKTDDAGDPDHPGGEDG